MTATNDRPMHTTITAQQGGSVGVKDMRLGGIHRITVRTQGTEGAQGIGSVYLTGDECEQLASLICPEVEVPMEERTIEVGTSMVGRTVRGAPLLIRCIAPPPAPDVAGVAAELEGLRQIASQLFWYSADGFPGDGTEAAADIANRLLDIETALAARLAPE